MGGARGVFNTSLKREFIQSTKHLLFQVKKDLQTFKKSVFLSLKPKNICRSKIFLTLAYVYHKIIMDVFLRGSNSIFILLNAQENYFSLYTKSFS